MSEELSQNQVDERATELGAKIQALIESEGFGNFEIETIEFKQKGDIQIQGLAPGCELKCKVGGFPPKLKCEVVCG